MAETKPTASTAKPAEIKPPEDKPDDKAQPAEDAGEVYVLAGEYAGRYMTFEPEMARLAIKDKWATRPGEPLPEMSQEEREQATERARAGIAAIRTPKGEAKQMEAQPAKGFYKTK